MNASESGSGGKYLAVRGPFSARKLIEEGYPQCTVFGDPALLLPLVYTPSVKYKRGVGLVPHMNDFNSIKSDFPLAKVVFLCGKIEQIIDEICSCEYIISTSLHGIIVAHAYGVPALWIKRGDICTDGFKFKDYFASVNIPLYNGTNFKLEELLNMPYKDLPVDIKEKMLPHKPIVEIQKALIDVAPFKVKKNIVDAINKSLGSLKTNIQ
jgi:hypothetical protein